MSGIPPIVLVVGLQDARAGACFAALEESGFWIALSASVSDAVRDIADLRPDVVIADLSTPPFDQEPETFVRALKTAIGRAAVPLVVVERARSAREPTADGAVDARLAKPLSPCALKNAVDGVLAASRAARRNAKAQGSVSLEVAEPAPVDEPKPPERSADPRARRCPGCGRRLVWKERASLNGIQYDYFSWCESGCGLYCVNVTTGQWLKLA